MKQKRLKFNTKGRSYYKTDNTYLNAVYKNNQKLIDDALESEGFTKDRFDFRAKFKRDVEGYMKVQGLSVTKAIERTLRSRTYLPLGELSKMNLIEGMKTSGVYKEFRELTKEHGRYQKFDKSKLKYEGDGVYSYGSIYIYTFDKYTTGDKKIRLEVH